MPEGFDKEDIIPKFEDFDLDKMIEELRREPTEEEKKLAQERMKDAEFGGGKFAGLSALMGGMGMGGLAGMM
jgi:hypothetical protein